MATRNRKSSQAEEAGEAAPGFEQAMAKLETIVDSLERGQMTLEDSLAAYEEGTRLVRLCSGRLSAIEERVKVLVEEADGTLLEDSGGENADWNREENESGL